MVYGIYLSLDQTQWFRGDFSSENKLTGTIYTDNQLVTAKDLTGFTVTIVLFRPGTLSSRFRKTATIVSAANGTWEYAVQDSEMPPSGIYQAKVELTKSGVQESTLNYVELLILTGPEA